MKAFLAGVVLAIVLSYFYPEVGIKGGPVHSELFIKKIGVGIIFFCSGMKLDPAQIRAAGLNWRAHLFCQLYTFGFTPLAMYLIITAVKPSLEQALADSSFVFDAVKTLACLPPPVSSAVILTAIARGDEAVAIFNSSVGSFLGIFITPVLVTLLVLGGPAAHSELDGPASPSLSSFSSEIKAAVTAVVHVNNDDDDQGAPGQQQISASEMAFELSLSVLAPLVVGQLMKHTLGLGKPPSWIGNLVLVLIIWASFCELWVSDITVTMRGLGFVLGCVVLLQACGLTLVWLLTTRVFKFDSGASTALLFACTHKSLTLGMPLIDVLFPLTASATSIPILMCHPLQILGGGILAGNLAKGEGALAAAASPRAIAYQAVHDATNDIELAANTIGEDSDAYADATGEDDDDSSYERDDDFDGTEVGGLFPREYDSPRASY